MKANEIEDDIIKIDINEFKKKLERYDDYNYHIPDNIMSKYNELIKKYNCFTYKYDAKSIWEKKKSKKINNTINTNKNRIYTFTTTSSDNNKIKKSMISYLNKITNKNRTNIFDSIDTLINSIKDDKIILNELYNILLIYISKNNDEIYERIIKLFIKYDNTIFIDSVNDFYKNKTWLPYEFIINNNILDDKFYDNYCDYIKWKNKGINIVKLYSKIIIDMYSKNDIIDKLLNDIYELFIYYLNNSGKKYIIDYLLELTHIIIKCKKNDFILNDLKKIDLNKVDNSTKFLLLNILEKDFILEK